MGKIVSFKIYFLILLNFSALLFSQNEKFYNKGKVEINQEVERIPLNFLNNAAIVKVQIEGKFYNFIFDTGAPLIISNKIFEELNLKTIEESDIKDAHQEIRKQKFTYLPELKLGNIAFKNFGAIVIDLEDPFFKCYKIDGIFGANQMSKLYWKIDYQNEIIEVTKKIKNFNTAEFKHKIRFSTYPQKTPLIYVQVDNKNKVVTFDTGFVGSINLKKEQIDIKNLEISENLISKYGVEGIGIYGTGKNSEQYIFKTNNFGINDIPQSKQIIETGEIAILGNAFLKNYIFILDWNKNEILLKEAENIPTDFTAFGFGYRILDGKAKVTYVYQNQNIPLQLEDEILSINNENVQGLSDNEACQYFLKSKKENNDELILKVKRGAEILYFTVKKHNFFKN
jgi:predicted aspartyl protease